MNNFFRLGLICLGKSALPEFGLTATTEPLSSGVTRNPWHTDYSTGGSSGRFGGPGGLRCCSDSRTATTAGGSIRIPAACCGLVGLKPSRGRLDGGRIELMPVNILHQGVLTRTVRDTAAFYAGAEKYRRNPKLPEIGLVQRPGKKRLRIALFTDTPYGTPCHPESADLVRRTGALCEELGHTVVEIPCPCNAQMADDFILYWGMMAFSIRFCGKFIIARGFDRSRLEDWTIQISRHFWKNFLKTPSTLKRLRGFAGIYTDIFSTCDILLNPTLAHPASRAWLYGTGCAV